MNNIQDFWKHIERKENECWEWTACRFKDGYGQVKSRGKVYIAHRLAYIFVYGEIPTGMLVLHKCDNPPCVNPDHLFIGTNFTNMQDMASKGRGSTAKLTPEQVMEIRKTKGKSGAIVAEQYGVHSSQIYRIWNGQSWKMLHD